MPELWKVISRMERHKGKKDYFPESFFWMSDNLNFREYEA